MDPEEELRIEGVFIKESKKQRQEIGKKR